MRKYILMTFFGKSTLQLQVELGFSAYISLSVILECELCLIKVKLLKTVSPRLFVVSNNKVDFSSG